MANEITVKVTGEDDFSKNIERGVSRAEGAFDKLGEAGGGAEQKFIGLSDSITGTQDVMQGLASGNIQQVAMGLADLSGAAEALWASFGKVVVQAGKKVAAMAADTAATIANTAATVANKVAVIAAEVASKAWAATQWLLNAALSANPIGLVVVAIAALVAAVILAYKNSETFRGVVDAIGRFFRDTFLPILQDIVSWLGDKLVPVLQAVWEVIRDDVIPAFQAIWGFIKDTLIPVISDVIAKVGEFISKAVEVAGTVIAKFEEIVNFIKGLPGRIADAAVGMWDGIKEAFRTMINWVIDKWNGLEFRVPQVDLGPLGSFGGFTVGVPDMNRIGVPNASGGDKQFGGGGMRRFATGGIVTSPTVGLIGEAGPEAVIPLNRAAGLGATFNVYALTKADAARGVAEALAEARRLGYVT